MNEIVFRDAGPADAEALSVAARESFAETFGHLYRPEDLAAFSAAAYSPDIQLAEILSLEGDTRLALDPEGRIQGFAQVGSLTLPVDPQRTYSLELKRLYVRPAYHGAGVAAELMRWAIARARERFAGALILGVWRENARAQRFYAKFGAKKIGAYKMPVGQTLDDEDILKIAL